MSNDELINVFEIFESISGEVSMVPQGTPIIFIRLAGCNLNCRWCDTKESRKPSNGKRMNVFELAKYIIMEYPQFYGMGNRTIMITGGEPLLQSRSLNILCNVLKNNKFKIMIETNGTKLLFLPSVEIDYWIVDYKLHFESQMIHIKKFANLSKEKGAIKFVIANKHEYEKALEIILMIKNYNKEHLENATGGPLFLLSPVHPELSGKTVSNWLISDRIRDTVVNVQIHKYLNIQ